MAGMPPCKATVNSGPPSREQNIDSADGMQQFHGQGCRAVNKVSMSVSVTAQFLQPHAAKQRPFHKQGSGASVNNYSRLPPQIQRSPAAQLASEQLRAAVAPITYRTLPQAWLAQAFMAPALHVIDDWRPWPEHAQLIPMCCQRKSRAEQGADLSHQRLQDQQHNEFGAANSS